MKLELATTTVLVAGSLAGTNAKVFGGSTAKASDPSTWSLADAKAWLQEHKVALPKGVLTQEQALKLVQDNLDGVAKRGARGAGVAQAYMEAISEKTIDA